MSFPSNGSNNFNGAQAPLPAPGTISPGGVNVIKLLIKIAVTFAGVSTFGFGLIFLLMMGAAEKHYDNLSSNGGKAVAIVTDVKESRETSTSGSGSSRRTSTTTYENKTLTYTVEGREFRLEQKDYKGSTPTRIGSEQNIFYDKSNPGTAVFEGNTPDEIPGFKIVPIALMIVGGIISLLGFFMLLPRRLRHRQARQ